MRRLAVSVVALVLGLTVLVLGLMQAGPPRVNIRWTPETTAPARVALERDLKLAAPVFRGSRTWSYQLLDTSRAHVRRILADPAVEDRHYFGPGATLAPEAPPLQAWLQAHYGRAPVSWITAAWRITAPVLLLLAGVIAWPALRSTAGRIDVRIAVLLLVAMALRVALIAGGGQYYWPDEKRYRGAQRLVAALLEGRLTVARDEILASPAALVQRVTGIIPASFERLVGDTPWIPAVFFAGASVLSIGLTGSIARRLGATRDTAFLATLLMVASTTMLYYSRHLLSYDLALAAGLIAVASAVRRPGGAWHSISAGVWAVIGFLAYPGSWPLTLVVGAIHLADADGAATAARRGGVLIGGAAAAIGAMAVAYRLVGLSFFDLMGRYAGAITQGEFAEGWRLPLAYLWSAEHGLLVVWGLVIAWCLWQWRQTFHDRLLRSGVVGAVLLYLLLAVTSTGLHRFVMYGRLARPLVPFLCLATAGVVGTWLQSRTVSDRARRLRLGAVTAAVVLQAAVNAWQPLHQEFPSEFEARVARRHSGPLVLMNVRHLYPGPEPVTVPSGFHEVAAAAHPLTFRPYQYEGYTPEERQVLRTSDIRMRIFAEAAAP